ncbi:MAG: hypothetical protein M3077_09075 [Candidatus Dormibacteraeota bacterium]|nr:hypothetical protein [Candidatus Dormibacteraeota bacterium]
MENRSRTAIILGGHVREALMAQPVVRAIPGAAVYAAPEAIGTLLGLPTVGRAFVLDGSLRQWMTAYRRLRTGAIDRVVLTAPVTASTAALAYFAGVPQRVMLDGPLALIATTRVKGIRGLDPVDANRRLASSVADGETAVGSIELPTLQPPPPVRQRVLERWSGFVEPGAYLVLVPGRGSWSGHRPGDTWEAERFAVVANQAAVRRLVILGGPGDESIVRETRAGIAKPAIAASLSDLTIEEVAVIAQGSLAVLGHDGDALHVAAASGATVLALLNRGAIEPRGPRVTSLPVEDFGRLPARIVLDGLERHLRVTTYA